VRFVEGDVIIVGEVQDELLLDQADEGESDIRRSAASTTGNGAKGEAARTNELSEDRLGEQSAGNFGKFDSGRPSGHTHSVEVAVAFTDGQYQELCEMLTAVST